MNKARDSSRQIEMKTGCAWHPVLTILVKKTGRGDWTRTSDLVVPDHARYQLRHTPIVSIVAAQSLRGKRGTDS